MVLRPVLSGAFGVAAIGTVILDVWRSFHSQAGLTISSLSDVWSLAHPASLDAARLGVIRYGQPAIWDRGIQPFLDLPAWLLLGMLALAIACLGPVRLRLRRHAPREADAGTIRGAPKTANDSANSDLKGAIASCRGALLGVALFSGVSNLLMLTGSFFMLEIYDRVLPSRSLPTLVALSILAGVLFAGQGLLDLFRARVLARIGTALDETLSNRIFDAIVRLPVRAGSRAAGINPIRDIDTVRSFVAGNGTTALFDLPWMPLYLAIVFAFHPLLGVVALAGAIVLVVLTVATEVLLRKPIREATGYGNSRNRLAEASRRNAEALTAMGFAGRLGERWQRSHRSALTAQQRASDVSGGLGSVARVLRMALQSAVLAVGAYLVIRQEATGGVIIAASILAARALAPIDLAIANWRGFVAARQSWRTLNKLFSMLPVGPSPMPLPQPGDSVSAENLSGGPPGEQKIIVHDIGFTINRGQGCGIIGPSGSGKSSLARLLVGAWLPARGRVKLDGASLDQWAPEALGRHIGYLPQDVELFAGSVAENISRFEPEADPEAIVSAARAADVHDLVTGLPNGYETQIGEEGATLSAGQRQRVALARALYGDPFLVVLDEPDANLDAAGELALRKAIQAVRARGAIAVVVSHRQSALASVDMLIALQAGRILALGPKDSVLQKLARPLVPAVEQLKVVPYATGAKS